MSTFDDLKAFLDARDLANEQEKNALLVTVESLRADRERLEQQTADQADRISELGEQITKLLARIEELEAETAQPTPGLFFEMPAKPARSTLVLAHYFPVFPLTIENANPATDYYSRNWLAVSGEGGVHASYGGRLRDRPLTSAPYSGDWRRAAAAEEIAAAIKYGLDGFFVNLMSTGHSNTYSAIRDEANANFPNFKIVPMVDTNGSLDDNQENIVSVVSSFIQTKNALQLDNGSYAVASFKAEGRDASWWSKLASDVKARTGRNVDFIHVYNSGSIGSLPQYAAGIWGPGTDPVTVSAWSGTKARADQLGVKSLYPVWPQDVRVKSGLADEARGYGGIREFWNKVNIDKPAFVQLCTWDDLTEASQFKPTAMRGTALLEYSSYRMAELRTGSKPKIVKDAVFVAHRNQTLGARVTSGQSVMMQQWRAPRAGRGSNVTDGFRDEAEIVTFLTKPQKITVSFDSVPAITYDAPAGESSK